MGVKSVWRARVVLVLVVVVVVVAGGVWSVCSCALARGDGATLRP